METNKPTVWKILMLGNYGNKELINLLREDARVEISSASYGILSYSYIISAGSIKGNIELVKVSVNDLGLKDGCSYWDICEKANSKFGLDECPNEVALQLCLLGRSQIKEKCLNIAMCPIDLDADQILKFFQVKKTTKVLLLDAREKYEDHERSTFKEEDCFIFCTKQGKE